MSSWDEWNWYKATPKKPPPEHGIKMKKSGSTWWGQRWIQALERMSRGYSKRLARGRNYARAGRTHDVIVQPGMVAAKVTGSRPTPYTVTLKLASFSDAVWDKAIAAMSEKAQFSAELLAGRMPQEIDAAFKIAGASLFPVKEAELATECNCPDVANPCKHIAAIHYVLGEAFDRDPFLLFELRGRSKTQVLEALRTMRTDRAKPIGTGRKHAYASSSVKIPTVSLGRVKAEDYDRLRKPLPALRLTFEPPAASGSLLRQLGKPPGWADAAGPVELLGTQIRDAAQRARKLAMAEDKDAAGVEKS